MAVVDRAHRLNTIILPIKLQSNDWERENVLYSWTLAEYIGSGLRLQ